MRSGAELAQPNEEAERATGFVDTFHWVRARRARWWARGTAGVGGAAKPVADRKKVPGRARGHGVRPFFSGSPRNLL